MNQILKRLEIIKSSILINDEEIIELQIMHLNKLPIDDEIKRIILKLENKEYSIIIHEINEYLQKYSGVVSYIDAETQALKLELKELETKLQILNEQKAEYLNDIEEFNTLYNLHLGDLIENILNLKKEILYKNTIKHNQNKSRYEDDLKIYEETKETIDEIKETIQEFENILEDIDKNHENYNEILNAYNELKIELENLENELNYQEESLKNIKEELEESNVYVEYIETKKNYQEFYSNYEDIKEQHNRLPDISTEEKKELKILWKKACKLCHPDIVTDDLKNKAHEIIQLLNEAYSQRDIEKVREILSNLENGIHFDISSEIINDKDTLISKINEYRNIILELESEIENIKDDETYQTIQDIDDMDKYFEEIKIDLSEEEKSLEKQIQEILYERKEKFDLYIFSKNLKKLKTYNELESYLESSFFELENFFKSKTTTDMIELQFDLEKILNDLLKFNLIKKKANHKFTNAFLILLAQQIEETTLLSSIDLILVFLPECSIKKRLKAKQIYLNTKDSPKEFFKSFDKMISTLLDSIEEDELNIEVTNILTNIYTSSYNDFLQKQDIESIEKLKSTFVQYKSKLSYLIDYDLLPKEFLTQYKEKSDDFEIAIEENEYKYKLYALKKPTFEKIRKISSDYISGIGNPDELYYQLNRGTKIIDNTNLLYKYMQSFGSKHKVKLYDAYEQIFENIQGKKINIIDWGCGQALATMLLLDFVREKNINLDIENITLIEPSQLALSRGLVHIDVLKQKEYNIKSINSDIDNVTEDDLSFNNNYKTLHLFSNILDVESFKLDTDFLQKISTNITTDNLFVCVSPNINDKRNSRIDLFYKHFDENFDTELISSRENEISGHKRYEKIFEVTSATKEEINEARSEIEIIRSNYQLNAIDELAKYETYVTPILNLDILKNTINSEPDYAIFKVRKVAEVITSNVYSNYEDNTNQVSFNDKIRYLSFEKKVFNKSITNYAHTIRTIGNAGVHSEDADNTKLTLDAHLIIIALISYINELKKENLI